MAHFAELNEDNVVLRTIVVNNNELLLNGVENEEKGIEFCKSIYGENTKWVQTSYHGTFRKNFAGVDCIYDPIEDYFFEPQPYPSWTLNKETAKWEAPVPKPFSPYPQYWNEEQQEWITLEPTNE